MDLRPRIAADIVDALLADLAASPPGSPGQRERWVEIARSKIVSHSIEFPGGRWDIGSSDPGVVEAYLTKYPKLREVVEDVRAKAEEIEPGVRVEVEVHSDPESCHVCHEGQSLTCEVQFRMAGGIEDPVWEAKQEVLEDWWLDYPGRYGPDRDAEMGEIDVWGRWRREDEEVEPPVGASQGEDDEAT